MIEKDDKAGKEYYQDFSSSIDLKRNQLPPEKGMNMKVAESDKQVYTFIRRPSYK
jgi:hypothetical protein